MSSYDFYRQLNLNNTTVDVLVDLTREKIILQFNDNELLSWIESLNSELKDYIKVTIGSDE